MEGPISSNPLRISAVAIERLRWRGSGARLGDSRDPATIARTLAYLFGFGAVLLLATLALPGAPGREEMPLVAISGAAFAYAGFLIAVYDRMPIWLLKASPGFGSVLVALVIYWAGPSASASYAMYYSWVVIAAGCFFSVRLTLAHGVAALITYAIALEAIGATGNIGLQLAMAAGSAAVAAGVMCGLARQLRDVVSKLEDAADTDPLTGVLNRRAFFRAFEVELARCRRSGEPVGLIVLDIDRFKDHNDAHGHPSGDEALRRCTMALLEVSRGTDVVARIGGEEFAVLAPETDAGGVLVLGERVRRALELEYSGESPPLTVSCGVASSPEDGLEYPELLGHADRALYRAKDKGRNRVESSSLEGRAR